MDPRWNRIVALFEAAAAMPDDERVGWLDQACGDDQGLRDELRSLLASDGDARLRAAVAGVAAALVADAATVGTRLGPYRLVELLGEGGMGAVWRATRDDDAFRRDVAIKVLRTGLASADAVARFRDERQILAGLDHPGIVRLLDGGTTDSGLPYLVMEHIDGRPLADVARALPVPDRVGLVARIADAVQYAHQKLVVHRDLKPANVLVDAHGAPRLLDFGIARLLDEADRDAARTRTGQALLTPAYASPEQARGERATVASDVYGLGAMLYELLAGVPPQRPSTSLLETLRAICEREPELPSIAAPALRRELRGDLDNITLRALQKAPGARYPSAAALAEDLRRYLDGRPVRARAATPGYRAAKFLRRHRVGVVVAGATTVALAVATAVSVVQARRAKVAADVAERQTRELLLEQAVDELAAGRGSRALPYLVEALRRGEDTPAVRFMIAEASRPFRQQLGEAFTAPEGLLDVAWSPDGATIALAGHAGLQLLDPELRVRATFATRAAVAAPRFSADGTQLAAVTDGAMVVWDVATGRELHRWPRFTKWTIFADMGERYLAAMDEARRFGAWDRVTGATLLARDDAQGTGAVAPDGTHVYVGNDGTIDRWEVATQTIDRRATTGQRDLIRVHVTRDGDVLSLGLDGSIWVGDAALAPRCTFGRHGAAVEPFALDASERVAMTGDAAGDLRVWRVATCEQIAAPAGPRAAVNAVDLSDDGTLAASAGDDNIFRVWDARTGAPLMAMEALAAAGRAVGAQAGTIDLRFAPDAATLLTISSTQLTRWRVSRAPRVDEQRFDFGLYAARWSPDGTRLVVIGYGATLIDRGQRVALEAPRAAEPWYAVDWRPDGTAFAVAGARGATIYAAAGTLVRALAAPPGTINHVSYAPDGTRLVTSGRRAAIVWDAVTGAQLATLPHPDNVMSAAWSPDGRRLATAGWDGALRIWDVAASRLVRTIDGGTTQFLAVAFSPDGATLASGGHDGEVSLWRSTTGARVRSLEGHTGPVTTVAWSPDGGLLATSADDGSSRVWDPASGRQLARYPTGETMDASWNRDGTRLVTVDHQHAVETWSIERDHSSYAELRAFVAAHSPWRLVGTRLVRAW